MTQKLSKRGAFLAASLVLGAALGVSSLSAQTVSTAPVGAVTKTINVGLNSVGITLLNPDLVVANASANTATTITLSGVTNAGALLTAGLPYYVEAVGGTLEGERFDVDTAATIAAANGSVFLNSASANNTFVLTSGNAIGTQFALRKHITLSQAQGFLTSVVANNNAALADQIQFLNSAGTGFVSYFLRATPANEWRQVGQTTSANNVAIPPGVGVIIKKNGASTTMVSVGSVRTNDFSLPQTVGLSLRAPAYPVSYSPQGFATSTPVANGWTANNNAALSDQLQVLNPAGTGFVSYFLRSSPAGEWRQVGQTTPVTTNALFSYDSGVIFSRKTADSNYILVSPVTL